MLIPSRSTGHWRSALPVAVFLILAALRADAQRLVVFDEAGDPVDDFEAMYHTANWGYSVWERGHGGLVHFGSTLDGRAGLASVDVAIRSDTHASSVHRFQGDTLDSYLRGDARIKIQKGRQVYLKLESAEPPPEGLLPVAFFPRFERRVKSRWQPGNAHIAARDFNMLNLKPAGPAGEYRFRLAAGGRRFRIAVHEPGWLEFGDLGEYGEDDLRGGVLTVPVGTPAKVHARINFGPGGHGGQSPSARYSFMQRYQGNSYFSVRGGELAPGEPFVSDGIGPGEYLLRVVVGERAVQDDGSAAGDSKPFFDRRSFTLAWGDDKDVVFEHSPFDPNAHRGDGTARLRVVAADGRPAAGRRLRVRYFDGHYGLIDVCDEPLSADGGTVLRGVSRRTPGASPYGPYEVSLDGELLGRFRFAPGRLEQDFLFRVKPRAGDRAPDLRLTNVENGEQVALSELRGRVVLVELWSTGCGPCQRPMGELVELYRQSRERWAGRVVIAPVSSDPDMSVVAPHVRRRGWRGPEHYWSKRDATSGSSEAMAALVAFAEPEAILIGPDGRIVWRGHPKAGPEGKTLAERIEELLTLAEVVE